MKHALLTRAALAGAILVAPAMLTAQNSHKGMEMHDIVAVATDAGQFKTLVAAIKAAGLVKTLQGAGPFTVFAPTDAAFAKLPKGALDALLADTKKLTALLTYHVVSGTLTSGDIVKLGGATPATVNGAPVTITIRDGHVFVEGARVVTADVRASNGVIHIIDSVIIPVAAGAGVGK